MQHQEIRIEVNTAVRHQLERRVVQKRSVFDGGAAGQDGGPCAIGGVRVDDGTQALRLGFAARGVDLLHRGGHLPAIANAGGGEQLHQVGAIGLQLLHHRTDLFGRAGSLGDLA